VEKMDKCPIVELGVSTTHVKKREKEKKKEKVSPCSLKSKDQRRGEIAI